MIDALSLGRLASVREVDRFLTGFLIKHPNLYQDVKLLRAKLVEERKKEVNALPSLMLDERDVLAKDKVRAVKMYYDRMRYGDSLFPIEDAKDKIELELGNELFL